MMACDKCTNVKPGSTIPVRFAGLDAVCLSCGSVVTKPNSGIDFSDVPHLGKLLIEAKQVITGDRQDTYGNPEDSFALIAEYWKTYIANIDGNIPGLVLTALDVAHMMTLFKIARCVGQKPDRDNYRDACGYLAIAADRLLEEVDGI